MIVRRAVRHSRSESTLCSLSPFPLFMYYRRSPMLLPAPPIPTFSTNALPSRHGNRCRPIHKNGLTLASHVAAGIGSTISIPPSDPFFFPSPCSYYASVTPLISRPRTMNDRPPLDADQRGYQNRIASFFRFINRLLRQNCSII